MEIVHLLSSPKVYLVGPDAPASNTETLRAVLSQSDAKVFMAVQSPISCCICRHDSHI